MSWDKITEIIAAVKDWFLAGSGAGIEGEDLTFFEAVVAFITDIVKGILGSDKTVSDALGLGE
ncbi:MAG: hypothetical protein FWG82_02325 [Oscillospiraceae bacterium]|nr:hypothetical protein [Oscillospiraceae bacterium]